LTKKITEIFTNSSISQRKQTTFLISIFFFSFLLRLAIFANTNVFSFSDYRVYYTAAFDIASGQKLPAFTSTGGTLMISHTGAWIINNLGSLDYWFYINISISCLTILIVWIITKKITGHNGIANLTILFLTFYTPYAVQTSIFYTQIVMISLASCIIILLIYAFETTNIFYTIIYTVAASALLILTMLFKWELLYFYILIGISSVYLYILKYRKAAFVSLLFCLLSLALFQLTLRLYEPLQEYLIKGANDLMFFGQTPYGGGEGVMLDSYREPYKKGLEEFKSQHSSEYEDNVSLRNAYNIKLIKDFIFNHPFQ
jgi:hypothetical protein